MKRVAILISGSGSNMEVLVRAMLEKGYAAPVLVISDKPEAGGLDKAKALGIETRLVDRSAFDDRASFEAGLQAALLEARADVICLAGFMRLLSAEFVDQWAGQMLNIHPSLLPLYKGLDTHARALRDGAQSGGCSVHLVTAAMDDGPVLGQVEVPIRDGDTVQTLAGRVLTDEHRLYPLVLERFLAGETDMLRLSPGA